MVWFNRQPIKWFQGMNMAQLLEQLEGGHLYAVVRLNGKLISRPNFHVTSVPENAILEPIPMVAGG